MSDGAKAANPQDRAMFSNLLASKPPKEAGAAAASTTASLIFHSALVAGAIAATAAVGEVVKKEEKVEEVTFVKIEEQPPPPPPPPEKAPPPPEVVKPKGFQTVVAPEIIPVEIPPPDTMATNEEDFSGEGVEGGVAEGEEVVGDEETVFMQGQVSVIPKMTKIVKPQYPDFLKKMEIEGTVVIQAIINTDGRVDAPSAKVIKKLHPQLDQAALTALTSSEFSPALYGQRPVRVIMQIPYTFKFK
ncbi:MAG: energy transducer TonB [Gemmatimonadetes bacterium]|nr:energy transducer TonB [Gemmatimonadota bacterium]